MKTSEEYNIFGKEWEKEMMKFPKNKLIDLLRNEYSDKKIKNNG